MPTQLHDHHEIEAAKVTLSPDEVADITGRASPSHQCKWLDDNGWKYWKAASGRPVVGRWYATLKLAGLDPIAPKAPELPAWELMR